MSGFSNETIYGINADFTSANNQNVQESNGLFTDGQIWIGSTATNVGGTHINVGTLTSPDSSVTIGYSSPNITLQASAAGIATINGDSGSITGSTVTIYANNAAKSSGSSVLFVNSATTSTLEVTDALANTMIGNLAGSLTVSGSENTSLGNTSLQNISSGVFNTAIGSRAMTAMQTGVSNTAVGLAALTSNVSGQENVAVGEQCLTLNTSSFNTCVGCKSMNNAGAANSCSFVGYAAGNALTSGNANSGVGYQTQTVLTTGDFNTSIGYQSLEILTTGDYNIALGTSAGSALASSESSNILIGNTGVVSESNTIRIGTQGSGAAQQNQTFIAGISGVTVAASTAVLIDANGQMGTILSSQRFKENIQEFESKDILKLRPVTFNYISDKTKEVNVGLIAEEVYEILPDLVILDLDKKPYSVKYDQIIMYLLSEVKKLHKLISKE